MLTKIKIIYNNRKGFTLIELLVVVAIIGILAAVGVTAFSGFQESAKKASSISNFKQVVKYITSETLKCSMGEKYAMDGNLNCSNQGICCTGGNKPEWKDYVADATVKALAGFKNPYYPDSSTPITKGGQYWYDKDVGFIRIHTESNETLQVWLCAKTPCGSKPHPNIHDAFTPIK